MNFIVVVVCYNLFIDISRQKRGYKQTCVLHPSSPPEIIVVLFAKHVWKKFGSRFYLKDKPDT